MVVAWKMDNTIQQISHCPVDIVDRVAWHGVHTGGVLWHFVVWQLITQVVPLPPPFPPSFHCFNSVTGACSSSCLGTHGWVARICQPWEQSSSRSFTAANSGSSWMFKAPNLHFSDAVVNNYMYIIIYRAGYMNIWSPAHKFEANIQPSWPNKLAWSMTNLL